MGDYVLRTIILTMLQKCPHAKAKPIEKSVASGMQYRISADITWMHSKVDWIVQRLRNVWRHES